MNNKRKPDEKKKTFKRMSIAVTGVLDRAILNLRMREKYVRLSYAELIRVVLVAGATALGAYPPVYPPNDSKKP